MDNDQLEKDVVTLGERRFVVIDFGRRTVAQDHHIMKEIRRSGVDKVLPMDGESDSAYVIRLQTALIDSGRACNLIAGYLIPEGKEERDWTPRMAEEIVAHISRCNKIGRAHV